MWLRVEKWLAVVQTSGGPYVFMKCGNLTSRRAVSWRVRATLLARGQDEFGPVLVTPRLARLPSRASVC